MSSDALLQALTDRIEIQELVARYNQSRDDVEPERFAECFVDDGAMVSDGHVLARGSDALQAMVLAGGFGTVHMSLDPIIDLDGDRARHRATMLLLRRYEDGRPNVIVSTGRYDDALVRVGGRWRFKERNVRGDVGGEHVLQLLGAAEEARA